MGSIFSSGKRRCCVYEKDPTSSVANGKRERTKLGIIETVKRTSLYLILSLNRRKPSFEKPHKKKRKKKRKKCVCQLLAVYATLRVVITQ